LGWRTGYEFREYQAGDSLHKIHWKLSAKKDILMVRKDEAEVFEKEPCWDLTS
jgi:uncharacterized protein (DUF58 family)